MDWSSLSLVLESQLRENLALFVRKIESQSEEIREKNERIRELEGRLQAAEAEGGSGKEHSDNKQRGNGETSHVQSGRLSSPVLPSAAVESSNRHQPMVDENMDQPQKPVMTADALNGAQLSHADPPLPIGGTKRRVSPDGDVDDGVDDAHRAKRVRREGATATVAVAATHSPNLPAATTPIPARTHQHQTHHSETANGNACSTAPVPAVMQTATSARKRTPPHSPPKSHTANPLPHRHSASPAASPSPKPDSTRFDPSPSPQPCESHAHEQGGPTTMDLIHASPSPPQLTATATDQPRMRNDTPQHDPQLDQLEDEHGGDNGAFDILGFNDPPSAPPAPRSSTPPAAPTPIIQVTPAAGVTAAGGDGGGPAPSSPAAPAVSAAAKPSALGLLATSFPNGQTTAAPLVDLSPSLPPVTLLDQIGQVTIEEKQHADSAAASGMVLAAHGDWHGSLARLDEAIGILSRKSWVLVPVTWLKQRSTVHAKLGHSPDAHADAQRMIAHHPTSWMGYYILSTLLGRDKNYAQALIECKKAWTLVTKRTKEPSAVAFGAAAERAERESESDRKKVVDRIRQLEARLHVPPSVLREGDDDSLTALPSAAGGVSAAAAAPHRDDVTGNHLSPPAGDRDRAIPPNMLQTPSARHNARGGGIDEIVSPTSTRAPTAPSSPMTPATTPATKKSLDFHSPTKSPAAMPLLTFGMYKLTGSVCLNALTTALRVGYRRIDTAASYANEDLLGRALTSSGLPRSSVYITSKIPWSEMHSEEAAYASAIQSMKKMDTRYLDSLLLHFPGRAKTDKSSPLHLSARVSAWRAAERLVGEGRVRAIGVANFEIKHLTTLMTAAKIKPKFNQIELHPLIYQTQKPLIDFCRSNHIAIEAYSSLGGGQRDLLDLPLLASIAKSCRRTIPEVLLQWSIHHGFIPLARSGSATHLQANFTLHTKPFTLTQTQINDIDQLEHTQGTKRFAWDPTRYA